MLSAALCTGALVHWCTGVHVHVLSIWSAYGGTAFAGRRAALNVPSGMLPGGVAVCAKLCRLELPRMQVRTYSVVPIGLTLGLVAFVEDSQSLKDVISKPSLIPKEVQPCTTPLTCLLLPP